MTENPITQKEYDACLKAGTSKEILDNQCKLWNRQDFIEFYDESPEIFTSDLVDKLSDSNRNCRRCPLCNELKWSKCLDRHIFTDHLDKLLTPFSKKITNLIVPLKIEKCIEHIYPDKPTRATRSDKKSNKIIGSACEEHGQDDVFLNPETNRFKKIHRIRPQNHSTEHSEYLYYCLICNKSWTTEKIAVKHFYSTDENKNAIATDCAGPNQIIKINTLLDVKLSATNITLDVKKADVTKFSDLNREIKELEYKHEIKELKDTIAKQKTRLHQYATDSLRKDREILKFKDTIQKLEGKLELKEAFNIELLERFTKKAE
jgi:hypothetical protein